MNILLKVTNKHNNISALAYALGTVISIAYYCAAQCQLPSTYYCAQALPIGRGIAYYYAQ